MMETGVVDAEVVAAEGVQGVEMMLGGGVCGKRRKGN